MALFTLTYKLGYVLELLIAGKLNRFHFIDGSLSDTAVSSIDALRNPGRGHHHRSGRGQQPVNPAAAGEAGVPGQGGMGKKSNSTSQLSAAGKHGDS